MPGTSKKSSNPPATKKKAFTSRGEHPVEHSSVKKKCRGCGRRHMKLNRLQHCPTCEKKE